MVSRFTAIFQDLLRDKLKETLKTFSFALKERWLTLKSERIVPVDIYAQSEDAILLVEVEIHRADPSNNVAKLLYWLDLTRKLDKEFYVFQVFSPFYQEHDVKRVVSEHLGEKYLGSRRRARYHSLDFEVDDFDEVYKRADRGDVDEKYVAAKIRPVVCELAREISKML